MFREATIADWERLEVLYKSIYREGHPLHNKAFWEWQYGDPKHGRAFIFVGDDGQVLGHIGGSFRGGIAWMINAYLDPAHRGKGIMSELYNLAREYHPMAATAANTLGLGMYHSMGWVRYYDLVRYVKVNPAIANPRIETVCTGINVDVDKRVVTDSHYFRQPGIKAIRFDDGSTGVSQESVGGLRVVDIENLAELERQAWENGYRWVDYITSWNDRKTQALERSGWKRDYETVVPWRLNPIQPGYYCDITFLSEEPLDKKLIVHRSFSDHGRVGSL